MATPVAPFLIFAVLFSAAAAIDPSCDAERRPTSGDLPVFHVFSKCSPFSKPATDPSPGLDSVLALARRVDPARLAFLNSLVTSVPIGSGQQIMQTANYLVRAKLGTPGQSMFMALDTSADAAWVPCSGCTGCPSWATHFSPAASSTYKAVDCSAMPCAQFGGQSACGASAAAQCGFSMSYGGDSFNAAVVQDSLMLGPDVLANYTFGCVNAVTTAGNSLPKQGLLGLGRGSTSLLSQASSKYQSVFSYCLPSFRSYYFSGSLRLGPAGQPRSIRTTPLLHNPHRPSLYYVNLTGVTVGRTPLWIPAGALTFDPSTGAGTVVDSGTVITRFVKPLYTALRDEFRRQAGAANYTSLGAFDTCYDPSAPGTRVPAIRLQFEGMVLALPAENLMIHSSAMPVACLAIAAAPDNVNSVVNVIANLQQQNHRVLIDVAKSRVGFARELCN